MEWMDRGTCLRTVAQLLVTLHASGRKALSARKAPRDRTTGGVIVIGIIGKISPDSVDKPHGWLDGSHR